MSGSKITCGTILAAGGSTRSKAKVMLHEGFTMPMHVPVCVLGTNRS